MVGSLGVPLPAYDYPRQIKVEKRFLTRDEAFALADAAAENPIPDVGSQYRALVLVLAFCGLRWGE